MNMVLRKEKIEDDILAEFKLEKEFAAKINMDFPIKKKRYNYYFCPKCAGLNAFPVYNGNKNVILVCDWCKFEF